MIDMGGWEELEENEREDAGGVYVGNLGDEKKE